MLKVGDEFPVWWSTGVKRDGWNWATIIEITPYTGLYKQWFTHVLKLTSLTPRGWIEMPINMEDYPNVND